MNKSNGLLFQLSTNKGLSTLICSKCITRLRDAYSFRTMVEETESLLLSTVRDIDKQLTVFVAGERYS